MTSENHVNYIELPASDFAATQTFYQSLFDWSFTPFGDEYLAFNDGRMDGGFYLSEKASKSNTGAALVIFYAADLEKTQARIKAAGGTICVPIFSFPGGRRFHFNDPHGNELAVWTAVAE